MKLTYLLLASLIFTCSCSLIPKKVEFGQRKVLAFPEPSVKLQETQKQAAELAAQKAKETLEAAIAEDTTDHVTAPAKDTADLTAAVSTSIGPPSSRWDKDTQALIEKLEHQIAGLNAKVEKFAKRNDEDAGKKIEGTGWLQIPYVVYVGVVLIIGFIGLTVLKVVSSLAAASNPGVAVGVTALRAGGAFASKMAGEVIKGGENFKEALASHLPEVEDSIKQKILTLFKNEHMKAQSPEVQTAIQQLTK